MGQEVGVEPGRIDKAATALENLRNALETHVPVIIKTMNSYWPEIGTPLDLGPLHRAKARSVDDAAGMRERSRAAQNWLHQHIGLANLSVATIPWDTKDLAPADAKYDAQTLAQAEAESRSNPQLARQQIQAVQYDIQYHVDTHDTKWLQDFYNQASPQVANLAATLNSEDGKNAVVLSAQDQKVLKTFATGLAATDKAGKLSDPAIHAYAKANNLWSVGMLFKFGPPGSAYGKQESWQITPKQAEKEGKNPSVKPNLLSQVTTAIEMARIKGGYTIPLTGPHVGAGALYGPTTSQALAKWDPAQTLLTLATQNGSAAREVLAGPNGQKIAAELMANPRTTYKPLHVDADTGQPNGFQVSTSSNPGPTTTLRNSNKSGLVNLLDQNTVGNFLDAATQGPDPKNTPPIGTKPVDFDAAQAALHIITATPNSKNAALSKPVRSALMNTFGRFMPDIAASVNSSDQEKFPYAYQPSSGDPFIFTIPNDGNTLQRFLQQIVVDKSDGLRVQTAVLSRFGTAFGQQMKYGPSGITSSDLAADFSGLYAEVDTAEKNLKYYGATRKDLRNEALNNLISAGESSLNALPVPTGEAAKAAWNLKGCAFSQLPNLSTDNAAKAAKVFGKGEAEREISIEIPMVQGLIDEGLVKPDPDWTRNGKIDLTIKGAPAKFSNWWERAKGDYVFNTPKHDDPPGQPFAKNPQNSRLLEEVWHGYGNDMHLAYTGDQNW